MVEKLPENPDTPDSQSVRVTQAHGPLAGEVQADGRIVHPAVSYERTDAGFPGVAIVLLAALGVGAVTLLGVWYFFRGYEAHEATIKRSPYPLAPAPATRLPAEPRLEQLDRLAGIDKPNVFLREQSKEAVLHGTGPTPDTGFVHIPIERAMQLLADELPVRQQRQDGPVKDNGLLDSGAPNAGRLYREGPR